MIISRALTIAPLTGNLYTKTDDKNLKKENTTSIYTISTLYFDCYQLSIYISQFPLGSMEEASKRIVPWISV